MEVKDALAKRQSIRAYLPKPVPRDMIVRILEAAGMAPSGVNMQPWKVVVVQGEAKQKLGEAVERAFLDGVDDPAEYQYYPEKWVEPFKGRRMACGIQMFETIKLERSDKEGRKAQWASNYRAFDAPVVIYLLMNETLGEGGFLDYGIFIQSIMLAAQEEGLGTCVQAALADYPGIVKKAIGYEGNEYRLIGGIAMGYADMEAPVNNYRTPRAKVEDFTTFID